MNCTKILYGTEALSFIEVITFGYEYRLRIGYILLSFDVIFYHILPLQVF